MSKEWAEWHLTPTGWELGTEKYDNGTVTLRQPPPNRVQTIREDQSDSYWQPHSLVSVEITWESPDKEELERLYKQHGTLDEYKEEGNRKLLEKINKQFSRPRR